MISNTKKFLRNIKIRCGKSKIKYKLENTTFSFHFINSTETQMVFILSVPPCVHGSGLQWQYHSVAVLTYNRQCHSWTIPGLNTWWPEMRGIQRYCRERLRVRDWKEIDYILQDLRQRLNGGAKKGLIFDISLPCIIQEYRNIINSTII